MTFILPERARVVRRLSIGPLEVSVTDAPGGWFQSYLFADRFKEEVDEDSSPRQAGTLKLRFAAQPLGPGVDAPMRVGERIETGDLTYEVMRRRSDLRSGRRVIGHEVAVLPVDFLYPHTGELYANDGTLVTEIKFSLYGVNEVTGDRSGYEEFDGEAGVEFAEFCKPNTYILVAGQKLRITRAWVPPGAPRVTLTLRRRDTNG